MDNWMTTAEAAELLGVTQHMVRWLIGEKHWKTTTAGRTILIDEPTVREFAKTYERRRGRPSKGGES